MKKLMPTVWRLDRLKPHPAQERLIRAMSADQLRGLAEVMRRQGGPDVPVEILPDGTVIDGHQRVAAARLLGWTEIEVVVRHDLVGNAAAVERRIIESNLHRKQLDPIDQTRLVLREMELDDGVEHGGLDAWSMVKLDKELAERLGRCPRHAKRVRRIVMATPPPVQHAVSAGRLAIVMAEKVAVLPEEVKRQIADEIEAGADPAEVVGRSVTQARRAAPDLARQFRADMATIRRILDRLDGREHEVRCECDEYVEHLRTVDLLIGFGKRLKKSLSAEKTRVQKATRQFKQDLLRAREHIRRRRS